MVLQLYNSMYAILSRNTSKANSDKWERNQEVEVLLIMLIDEVNDIAGFASINPLLC